jgi:hypothetical protein
MEAKTRNKTRDICQHDQEHSPFSSNRIWH